MTIVCSLASCVASAVLLSWVSRLDKSLSLKLMARQLWHLAISDILYAVFNITWFSLDLLSLAINLDFADTDVLSKACYFGMGANVPLMVSVVIEVHLALSMAASVFHASGVLKVLSMTLPVVWLLGVVLGVPVMVIGHGYWNLTEHECDTKILKGEYMKAFFCGAGLVICGVLYLVVFLRVRRHSGQSVQARIFRRTRMFIVAAVVSWIPFVVYVAVSQSNGDSIASLNQVFYNICHACLHSNGLFNALVYARKSSVARQFYQHNVDQHNGDIQTDIHVQSVPARPQHSPTRDSYSVSFDLTAQVVAVEPLTATANARATEEVAVLQGNKSYVAPEARFLLCFDEVAEGDESVSF